MVGESNVKLTINFSDPDLDAKERDEEVQQLLTQMKDMDEVTSADRIPNPNPPAGSKALGGFLVGLLTAEVNLENMKAVLRFLSDRLSGKTIEMEVEAKGKKLKVKASSREELMAAIQAAQDFVSD